MKFTRLAVTGAAIAGLMLASGPVFAKPANEPSHGLRITQIVATGTTGTYNVTVSGLTNSSTTVSGPYYVGFRYNMTSNPRSEGDDSGHQFQGQINVESSAPTQTFTLKIPNNATTIDVAEYSSNNKDNGGEHDGNEVRNESPAVSVPSIPNGQLPEVPFAVGIPVVVLGAALPLKRRLGIN